MIKIITIAALVLSLGACTGLRQCPTGQTAVSMQGDKLVYTPVMGPCPIPASIGPNTGGIFAEGPMAAPAPGKEWWNAF